MCCLVVCIYEYDECNTNTALVGIFQGKLPKAFYRIENAEAQRFVGKCLVNVSKRLPAKELLLDPFLASDEVDSSISKFPCKNLSPEDMFADFVSPSEGDSTRSTNMTITGTLNPEDETIFLKVQISDGNDGTELKTSLTFCLYTSIPDYNPVFISGHTRNIYFPFDTLSDTPNEVALEMVKELEITDWEPLEIAEMIEEEISNLVPNWKQHVSQRFLHHQHSFYYSENGENDDENQIHHPFYASSSHSSSYASLPGLVACLENKFHIGNHHNSTNQDYLQQGNNHDHEQAHIWADSILVLMFSLIHYRQCT